MLKYLLGALMAAACVGTQHCQAQVTVKHAPKYAVGSVIVSEVAVQTNQTLTIAGMPLETKADNFIVLKETVESASPDGSAVVKGGFQSMQLDLDLPGGLSYEFNSENPGATKAAVPELNDVTKFLSVFSKANWTSKMGTDGRVQELKYVDDPLSQIPESMRTEADPKEIMRQANQDIDRLPGKEVAVGDSWERQEKSSIGSGQIFHMQKKFTYKGLEDHDGKKLHRIDVETGKIEYEATQPMGPLEVKGSDMKVESSKGSLWYDSDLGRVVDSNETIHIVGDIKFSVMGNELPGTVDLTMTTSAKSR